MNESRTQVFAAVALLPSLGLGLLGVATLVGGFFGAPIVALVGPVFWLSISHAAGRRPLGRIPSLVVAASVLTLCIGAALIAIQRRDEQLGGPLLFVAVLMAVCSLVVSFAVAGILRVRPPQT